MTFLLWLITHPLHLQCQNGGAGESSGWMKPVAAVSTPVYRGQQDGSREDSRGRKKRNRHLHSGSAPGFAIELKLPVQLEHAFSHIDQT